MEDDKVKKIHQKVEEIMDSINIAVLKDEKEIAEKLDEISKSNGANLPIEELTLNKIEAYLKIKEKFYFAEEDLKFLNKLANDLKEQSTRRTDGGNPPLFKIKDSLGNELFFLTRASLEEYCEVNQKDMNQLIEIPSSKSMELEHLLNIIKRNF